MSYSEQGLPFGGSTPISRHASWTGAEVAARRRGPKTRAYVVLLYKFGACTDSAAAMVLHEIVVGVQSICSIRNSLCSAGLVEAVDTIMADTGARNTRWDLTPAGRAAVAAMLAEGAA